MLKSIRKTTTASCLADPRFNDVLESRALTLGGILLIGAISMQFVIFAIVLIGGHSALVAIGATMSWMTSELERMGGSLAMPLATCVFVTLSCAFLAALDQGRWIALPKRVQVWTTRTLRLAGSAAILISVHYFA